MRLGVRGLGVRGLGLKGAEQLNSWRVQASALFKIVQGLRLGIIVHGLGCRGWPTCCTETCNLAGL